MVIRARFNSRCPKCGGYINVGDEVNWSKGEKATHINCPAKANSKPQETKYDFPTYKIYGGSGYGCQGWTQGQVIQNRKIEIEKGGPDFLFVLSASKRYFREDGMSCGVGDESGYAYSAVCRAATNDESAPRKELIENSNIKLAASNELKTLSGHVRETGEFLEGDNTPEGDIWFDKRTIYGGGDWWVIGTEWIWYVLNNGADGDDWSRNNVRTGGAGAIGWRVPRTDKMISNLTKIRKILEEK